MTETLRLDGLRTIEIQKIRWLRKFDTSKTTLREIELNDRELPASAQERLPDEGCNVELTEISLNQGITNWWTLGFESFGSFNRFQQNLLATLGHLSQSDLPSLAPGLELSYPAWLSVISSDI